MKGITAETAELLHKTNRLAEDIQEKSEKLNTVVHAVQGVGTSVQQFNTSIKQAAGSVSTSVRENQDKINQVVTWSQAAMEIWEKWKQKKKHLFNHKKTIQLGGIIMSKDGINSKDFLIGTLIGGIIGATTALFLAPKSGKELRDDLGNQAVALKDRTDRMTADAKEKGSEYVSIAKDKTSNITQLVADQSGQIMNKVKDLKDRSKNTTDTANSDSNAALNELGEEAKKRHSKQKIKSPKRKTKSKAK